MTQFPHDEFVKDYLPQLLGDYGEALPAMEVATQVKEIDVLFIPNAPVPTEILGLLAQMAQTTCLFEVFRNSVSVEQIKSCLGKLFDLQRERHKQIKKTQQLKSHNESIQLWILTPTLSDNILVSFRAQLKTPSWPVGVYFLAESLNTGIIVIHELPVTFSTLWLRILGKGKIQQAALNELENLPPGHPYQEIVLELVNKLLSILEVNRRSGQRLEPEDEELIMRISTLYTQKLQEAAQLALEQGVQQGIQQGVQQGVQLEAVNLTLRLLKRQLGELPPELETLITNLPIATVENLAEALFDIHSLEDLSQWLNTHVC